MTTQPASSTEVLALKKANKTFKFWYNVLLETEYMNDLENRKDFQTAIQTIADSYKKKKEV
ncbi:hypothetical protein [Flavobacterium sp.]|uniref:hypothetical protein n=1 Tax=Flavobacterium sp. TaxID=239 RepID=UPI003751C7DD